MRHLLNHNSLTEIKCDSAGTLDYHTGKPPDNRMSAVLESRGIKVSGKARQVTAKDLVDFDQVLTMDEDNYNKVMKLPTADQHGHKVKKFVSLCQTHCASEVPDPYYGGSEGFEHVADILEDGCQHLIQQIKKSLHQE